jgi:hypothetical protein
MILHEKEKLFLKFLLRWKTQLDKIPAILKYLSAYPEIIRNIDENFKPISIEELYTSQLEWISLVAQFDNPIEINFFKDFWVPVQKDGYDYFIDLSSASLPLFEANYFFFEPYRWYKKYIFKDLTQFLTDIDKPGFDTENYFKSIKNNNWNEIQGFFKERDELGFSGKISLTPIDKDSLFFEEVKSDYKLQDESIMITGISSVIVGLLPLEWSINLEKFKAKYSRHENLGEKIKNIKALLYLIQSVGLLSVDSYTITLDSNIHYKASYKDNTFVFEYDDNSFLNSVIDKYENIKNQ